MEIRVVDEFKIMQNIANIVRLEAKEHGIEVNYCGRYLVKTRSNVVHKKDYEEYDYPFHVDLKGNDVTVGVYGRKWMKLAQKIAKKIQKELPDLSVTVVLEQETVLRTDNKESEYGGPSGGCFIATASYGSPLAPQLDVLRSFRDTCLPSLLVQCYYKLSPPIAQFISGRSKSRRIIRGFLEPLVKLLKWKEKMETKELV